MIKINEEMFVRGGKKIRDSLHDVITELEVNEFYDLGTVCNKLRHEYNIFITPNLLKRLLITWEKGEKDDSFLKQNDKSWLKWDEDSEVVLNNLRMTKKSPSLGKSRRKLIRKEEKEKEETLSNDGWVKTKNGWELKKVTDTNTSVIDKKIAISRYEKERYDNGENPITTDLVNKIFVIYHIGDLEFLSDKVRDAILSGEITTPSTEGDKYYMETWNYIMKIADEIGEIDKKSDYMKYAPSLIKEKILDEKQKKKSLRFQVKSSGIKNRKDGISKLSEMLNLNEKHYIIVLKHNNTKKSFYIKKILYGYITLSDDVWPDGNYAILFKVNKEDENELIYFNTLYHLEKAMSGGVKGEDDMIFGLIKGDNTEKLKYYFNEFKRYTGWDEYLDEKTINSIKNDF